MDNIINVIPGGSIPIAEDVVYSNNASGIAANNVQTALDVVSNKSTSAYSLAVDAYDKAENAGIKANAAQSAADNAMKYASDIDTRLSSVSTVANTASNTASNAYTQANSAYSRANSAYTQANNAANAAANGNITYQGFYVSASPHGGISSVSANSSVAIGSYANANNYSVSIGQSSNSNANSVTIGGRAFANNRSIAIGAVAFAPCVNSIAIGYIANAQRDDTLAIGYNASAYDWYSIAIGRSCNVNSNVMASSPYGSIGIGWNANVGNNGSIAIGKNTMVNGAHSVVLGAFSNTSTAFSVALGYQAVCTSGNTIQLGNASSLSKLSCRVNITVTSDERDKTDIVDVEGSATEFLKKIRTVQYVYNHRELYIDNENLSEKDREKKSKYGLCEYNTIAHKKGTKKGTRKRVGVLAQNVQQAMKEIYGSTSYANIVDDNFFDLDDVPDDVENQLSVNYSGFVPFLIKAIQELSERLDALENKGV